MTLVLCGGVILFMHGHITKNKQSLHIINMIFRIGPENNEKTIKKMKKNQKNKQKNHKHTPSKVRF